MRLDITRPELEAIVNALKGQPLKSERKLRERLAQVLDYRLHPSKAPDSNGWAPMKKKVSIRSSWPSGDIKRSGKGHWSFHKPRDKKTKTVKKQLTADDILASI